MVATKGQSRAKSSSTAMFRVEELTKVYHTGELEIHPLSGADLALYEGEFAVLLGPSGSGKSTLLNILAVGAYRSLEETRTA